MKKTILILCTFALITLSCDKDNSGQLDSKAMISIRPEKGTKSTNPDHLTALEIVKQATDTQFFNRDISDQFLGQGFHDTQRDTINVRFLIPGSHIINAEGGYEPFFIEGEDMVLITTKTEPTDTIGYIKNATLRDAEKRIKAAYAKKDYAACYAIYDDALTFLPITGTEWRELKRQGIN